MYSGGSLEVETSLKSFGTVDPGSLRGCQKQSQTDAMYSGDSLESKLALSRLAPWILEVCEGAKDSRRPVQCTLEGPYSRNSLKSFGTVDPGSLRGCQKQSQTDAMYSGDSLEVETSVNSFSIGILEVCEGAKDSRRPVQCTLEGP